MKVIIQGLLIEKLSGGGGEKKNREGKDRSLGEKTKGIT